MEDDDGFGDIEEKLLFQNMHDIEKITEAPNKISDNIEDIKNSEEPKKEKKKKKKKI